MFATASLLDLRPVLLELSLQNLVIVERARLAPGLGLTVVSGETGAGKSLLLDALELICGGRAQARMVGPRGDDTTVVGVFAPEQKRAALIETACGVSAQDGQYILRRRITATGRSQAWINDVPVTVTALAAAAERLVEIRAQHEAQRLGDRERQMELLDTYAGLDERAAHYRAGHQRCLDLTRQLDELEHGGRDSLKELGYLSFQSQEFRSLDPQPGELATLEARLSLLGDAARWRDGAARAADQLTDGERSVTRILAGFARQFSEAPDAQLAEAGRALMQAQELIQDAARTCSAATDRLHADPAELARLELRRDAWYDLMRKHGDGEPALFAAWESIEKRISDLEGLDGRRERMASALSVARDERARQGEALAAARAKAFTKLAKAVESELSELGMPKAKLSLSQELTAEPALHGTVRQEFLVATNPGLSAGPLATTVSGGEAARLSLALAVVLAEVDRMPVLVFDEVDSGVGGRLGAAIGGRLARLGRDRTVLAVTHTPQVAAAARQHYRVHKRHGRDETMVDVEEISGERRIDELAEMLGGGAAARTQAKVLMQGAGA